MSLRTARAHLQLVAQGDVRRDDPTLVWDVTVEVVSDRPPTSVQPSCYRHPSRNTGVTCQRCGNPICTSCMNQASVGFQCPECVSGSSQKVIRARDALAPSQPVVTTALIAINVAAFFYAGSSGFNGAVSGQLVAEGQWWRLITSGFLHIGLLHIGMNMWALWQLGRGLEQEMGSVDFTILYFGSLFAGSLAVVALSDNPAEGASGAVFGLFGALAVLYSSRGISLVKSGIMGLLIMNLGISLLPGISWQGHLGGFLAGLLFGAIFFLWDRPLRKVNPSLPELLAVAAAAAFFAGGYYLPTYIYG